MSDCFVLYLLLTCMKKKTSGADKFTNNSISTLFTAFGSYLLNCFWMSFTNLSSGMTANDSIVRPSVPAV